MNTRARRPLWWRLFALLAALSLIAAACGDDDDNDVTAPPPDDEEPTEPVGEVGASVDGVLRLGAVLPQTGDLAPFGPGMLAAVEMAVEDINAAGGVLGNDVELVSADSGTDPSIANTAVERMITSDNVDAIIGAAGSTVSLLGVIEPTIGAGRLQCSGSNTGPAFTTYDDDGLYFRTAPSDTLQSQLLADTIAGDGHSTVAILNRADDYGQSFADIVTQEIEDRGGEVVVSIAYDHNAASFDSEAEQVSAAAPDAAVVIAFPEDGARVLSAMIEAGVGPGDIDHYYTDGLAESGFPEAVDPDNPGVFDGTKGTAPGAAEEPTAFNDRLRDEMGVEETTFAAQFYDCVVMIALAAEAAGTDDPMEIRDVLGDLTRDPGEACDDFESCKALLDDGEDINFSGVTGFDLDDNGEPDQGVYDLWEFRDSEQVFLERGIVVGGDEDG